MIPYEAPANLMIQSLSNKLFSLRFLLFCLSKKIKIELEEKVSYFFKTKKKKTLIFWFKDKNV